MNYTSSKRLKSNRALFLLLESLIEKISFLPLKRAIARRAIRLAVWSSTGRFSSPVIERVYLELADRVRSENAGVDYEPDSTLHVLTECYGVGGHSKVVERWISNSDSSEKHSVVFIAQKRKDIPQRFFECVNNKTGQVFCLSEINGELNRARCLRVIASRFERVVLHTHMYDTTPLIAFGTDDFKRPIILYNHADHLFWLGGSIADRVAETRSWGKSFSSSRRGIDDSFVLSIPPCNTLLKELELASKLNSKESFNILTVGSPHKYTNIDDENFSLFIKIILAEFPHVTFTIVGPTSKDIDLSEVENSIIAKRIRFLGIISNNFLQTEFRKSDLVIDSFPMSGGTALGEAITIGAPVLAYKSVTGHLDYMYGSDSYCATFTQLLVKTRKAIQDPSYRIALARSTFDKYLESENIEQWRARVSKLYALLPKNHKVRIKHNPDSVDFDELDLFLLLSSERKRVLLKAGDWFTVSFYRKRGSLRFSFDFFSGIR